MKASHEVATPSGAEGMEIWRDHIDRYFDKVELVVAGPKEPFHGRFRIDATATTRSCRVAGAGQTILRPERACGPEIGIMKILSGRTLIHQAGQTHELQASDVIVFDNRRPYRFDMPGPFEHALLLLDRGGWAPEVAAFDSLGYGSLPRTAVTRTLSTLLEQVVDFAPTMTADELSAVALPIAQLALASRHPDLQARTGDRAGRRLFQRICADVRSRLADPDLAPSTIAGRHRISLRYLHKLFAMHGMSVMQFVRTERLARCAADLREHGGREHVATIAARWGFYDDASFRRAFRAHFGVSPGAYRAGSGGEGRCN